MKRRESTVQETLVRDAISQKPSTACSGFPDNKRATKWGVESSVSLAFFAHAQLLARFGSHRNCRLRVGQKNRTSRHRYKPAVCFTTQLTFFPKKSERSFAQTAREEKQPRLREKLDVLDAEQCFMSDTRSDNDVQNRGCSSGTSRIVKVLSGGRISRR